MIIDRRAHCAVEAMANVALHGGRAPCRPTEIAARLGESPNLVGYVMARLKAAGLLTYEKQPIAGYSLAVPAGRISIVDIFEALEDKAPAVPSAALADDDVLSLSGSDLLWPAVHGRLMLLLCDISLADMLEDEDELALAEPERLLLETRRSRTLH